jgi:antirestriction protein
MLNFNEPAVYCGTYAKYNDGDLSGQWLTFSDYSNANEFFAACRELHQDEKDPEFMFQDFENFPQELYNESMSILDIEVIYKYIELCKNYDQELVDQVISDKCGLYEDVEEALEKTFYLTDYDSDFSVGVAFAEIFGGVENLSREELERYFDFDAYGRDNKINHNIIKTDSGNVYCSFH